MILDLVLIPVCGIKIVNNWSLYQVDLIILIVTFWLGDFSRRELDVSFGKDL
jgi:hypothetical protein